jgi:hypothetical protein
LKYFGTHPAARLCYDKMRTAVTAVAAVVS